MIRLQQCSHRPTEHVNAVGCNPWRLTITTLGLTRHIRCALDVKACSHPANNSTIILSHASQHPTMSYGVKHMITDGSASVCRGKKDYRSSHARKDVCSARSFPLCGLFITCFTWTHDVAVNQMAGCQSRILVDGD